MLIVHKIMHFGQPVQSLKRVNYTACTNIFVKDTSTGEVYIEKDIESTDVIGIEKDAIIVVNDNLWKALDYMNFTKYSELYEPDFKIETLVQIAEHEYLISVDDLPVKLITLSLTDSLTTTICFTYTNIVFFLEDTVKFFGSENIFVKISPLSDNNFYVYKDIFELLLSLMNLNSNLMIYDSIVLKNAIMVDGKYTSLEIGLPNELKRFIVKNTTLRRKKC